MKSRTPPNLTYLLAPDGIDTHPGSTMVLLCPGIGNANPLVSQLTRDALTDFLLNHQDPYSSVDDCWYYSAVSEHCFDTEGQPMILFGDPMEQLAFACDPYTTINQIRFEVGAYLKNLVKLNKELILLLYSTSPSRIEVLKTFNDHILLKHSGSPT